MNGPAIRSLRTVWQANKHSALLAQQSPLYAQQMTVDCTIQYARTEDHEKVVLYGYIYLLLLTRSATENSSSAGPLERHVHILRSFLRLIDIYPARVCEQLIGC